MVIFKTVCTGVSVRKYIFASVYDADDHCRSAQIFARFVAIVQNNELFVVHGVFFRLI